MKYFVIVLILVFCGSTVSTWNKKFNVQFAKEASNISGFKGLMSLDDDICSEYDGYLDKYITYYTGVETIVQPKMITKWKNEVLCSYQFAVKMDQVDPFIMKLITGLGNDVKVAFHLFDGVRSLSLYDDNSVFEKRRLMKYCLQIALELLPKLNSEIQGLVSYKFLQGGIVFRGVQGTAVKDKAVAEYLVGILVFKVEREVILTNRPLASSPFGPSEEGCKQSIFNAFSERGFRGLKGLNQETAESVETYLDEFLTQAGCSGRNDYQGLVNLWGRQILFLYQFKVEMSNASAPIKLWVVSEGRVVEKNLNFTETFKYTRKNKLDSSTRAKLPGILWKSLTHLIPEIVQILGNPEDFNLSEVGFICSGTEKIWTEEPMEYVHGTIVLTGTRTWESNIMKDTIYRLSTTSVLRGENVAMYNDETNKKILDRLADKYNIQGLTTLPKSISELGELYLKEYMLSLMGNGHPTPTLDDFDENEVVYVYQYEVYDNLKTTHDVAILSGFEGETRRCSANSDRLYDVSVSSADNCRARLDAIHIAVREIGNIVRTQTGYNLKKVGVVFSSIYGKEKSQVEEPRKEYYQGIIIVTGSKKPADPGLLNSACKSITSTAGALVLSMLPKSTSWYGTGNSDTTKSG